MRRYLPNKTILSNFYLKDWFTEVLHLKKILYIIDTMLGWSYIYMFSTALDIMGRGSKSLK